MDELIYDRTQADADYALANPSSVEFLKGAHNYTDYNRIEEWCKYLAEYLTERGYKVTISTKTNWGLKDFPDTTNKERIRQNLIKLKNAFYSDTNVPDTLAKTDYQKANDIERILHEINEYIKKMEASYWYSGEVYSGEV